MLNVSATQQMQQEKDAEIAALVQKIAVLEARDRERESRLVRLEAAAAASTPARVATASVED